MQINCLLGGWGLATGKAWFDDVRLEQIGKSKAASRQPSITIDAAKTGEPISKYIYGQFIEHLGRCIYGGIWAEMLEDRKFFYAGRRARSRRGRPSAGASAVTMVDEGRLRRRAHAADHAGRRRPAGGIVQAGLGLSQGQEVRRPHLAGGRRRRPARSRSASSGATAPDDRQTVTIDAARRRVTRRRRCEFTAGGDHRQRPAGDRRPRARARSASGTVSLMPADNVHGMRADTLALLKELDSPVYRWPGGNFVSGYDWKDGIGDRDRRPPRKNPAWTGHRAQRLRPRRVHGLLPRCSKTEPYIAVNSGLGDVEDGRRGGRSTPTARPTRRWASCGPKNGHAEPYGVKCWGIGNEMYGDWQLGHMPLEKYVAEAQRVRRGDAGGRSVDQARSPWAPSASGARRCSTHCADHMDLISEHFYCQEKPGLAGHVRQIPDDVRAHGRGPSRLPQARSTRSKGKDIRIALDEWNYWYGPHVFGELGTRYFLKDGLGIAAGLHEYRPATATSIFMANYAQTVNVIGCIKTSKTAAALRDDGPGAEALPPALRRGAGGDRDHRQHRRHGRLERGPQDAHRWPWSIRTRKRRRSR